MTTYIWPSSHATSDGPSPNDPGRRLESWKEIAVYLGRGERTVRRWEACEGLPIHRLHHAKRGSVFATTSELDAWRDLRQKIEGGRGSSAERSSNRRSGVPQWRIGAAIALALVAAVGWISLRPDGSPARTPHPEAVRALARSQFAPDVGRTQVQTGIQDAREAIRLDPEFDRAWTRLAMSHVALTWFDEVRAIDTMGEARKEAERALQLNPASGTPLLVLGWVSHYVDWNHAEAERHFRRAIERNPAVAVAHSWFADVLVQLRRFDEAERSYRAAQDISPRWLEPIILGANLHTIRGHFDLAEAEFRRALEVGPSNGLGNHFYGRLLLSRGDTVRAIARMRRSNELMGDVPFSLADLGYALALGGERRDAEALVERMRAQRGQGYYPAFAIAIVELGLGRIDSALDWLDRTADERHLGFYLPSADPIYAPLRTHPRFMALMERIRLPPAGATVAAR
jgi:serine/threonine-protein kinase